MHYEANKQQPHRLRRGLLLTAAIAATGALIAVPAQAQPALPGAGSSNPVVEQPAPQANFAPPNINIADGETVGVAQPIIITFKEPIEDRAAAERAIKVTSSADAPGNFYWTGDKQVRWKPAEFWPANTDVTVVAGGTTSSFHIGDAFVATVDDATKVITVTRNGEVVREMPTSLGKPGYETPNGTYIVGERLEKMTMDSSTYGVPVTDPEGYKLEVEYATRLSNSGIFIHAAPWSVGQQGYSNASHGCLNVSTEDAKWFLENSRRGDAVIVTGTQGPTLSAGDGLGDWN
ncbi:L,D-transpeptidase [Nocardia caishijiensis]|uniref:Lipoprotein-anchoring transpeptidase ErfK/SrfK n=1 Tax=Nocardia caishijiensis TaxID=184756 RepID=A0ABQ6YUN7_9NOCA|nr:L,D-transpeptidase [Nocardia caishijiensis]KAF0849490.1 lipoprotein-anchoring transpeptidase ErfK/SrfK [Nocardia caishijiensis]